MLLIDIIIQKQWWRNMSSHSLQHLPHICKSFNFFHSFKCALKNKYIFILWEKIFQNHTNIFNWGKQNCLWHFPLESKINHWLILWQLVLSLIFLMCLQISLYSSYYKFVSFFVFLSFFNNQKCQMDSIL